MTMGTVDESKLIKEFNSRLKLCSNNLICYHNVFKTTNERGYIFLIMSYIEGQELGMLKEENKLVLTFKSLTYDEKLKITNDLVNAVETLHSIGIAHKDIRLENIIYDRRRNKATLIDYGFSCIIPKFLNNEYEVKCDTMESTSFYKKLLAGKKLNWKEYDNFCLEFCLYILWFEPKNNYFQIKNNMEKKKEEYKVVINIINKLMEL